jgi:hypothetical protein
VPFTKVIPTSARNSFSKFFQGVWKPKKDKKNGNIRKQKQQGAADPSKIAQPGGMRGASGEVRRG